MKISEMIVLLVVVMLLYCLLSIEEDITTDLPLESKCELALRNTHDIHKNVIEQCKKLLKEKNEPE